MPHHVVVDGSNLATEGRAMPSLAQLNDAVTAFMEEHPEALITVVVDATFGHRIDASEVKEFDEAVANNEVVAPPAGAIGRGDAFLLGIAHKVGATVLSNDSFQEFHGTYTWLFDEGRLIGGKPVPHIGWVFVARVPVRGPISRTAVKDARRKKSGVGDSVAPGRAGRRPAIPQASPQASLPMPIPKAPPPRAVPRAAPTPMPAEVAAVAADTPQPAASKASAPSKGTPVNELLPFLSFVEAYPIGTPIHATVESYSSHGAYVRLPDGVAGYVPLRMMADPAPRSAREFCTIGEEITLVVESFNPTRRSIDLATVPMATAKPHAAAAAAQPKEAAGGRRRRRGAAAVDDAATVSQAAVEGGAAAAATPEEQPTSEAAPIDAGASVDAAPAPAPAKRSRKKAAAPTVVADVATSGMEPAASATEAGATPEPEATPPAEEPAPAPAKRTRAPKAAAPARPRATKRTAATPAAEGDPAAADDRAPVPDAPVAADAPAPAVAGAPATAAEPTAQATPGEPDAGAAPVKRARRAPAKKATGAATKRKSSTAAAQEPAAGALASSGAAAIGPTDAPSVATDAPDAPDVTDAPAAAPKRPRRRASAG